MLDRPTNPNKTRLIERAFEISPFRSFADLGGCWGVNGGYAFHARKVIGDQFERGCIVDQHITPLTQERAVAAPGVELITGMLGSAESRAAVGKVDALIMYDIVLHQVAPDWNEFVLNWLGSANVLIIYNQNWLKDRNTVRFVDQGFEWFRDNVFFTDEKNLKRWFEQHHELDVAQQKLKRDAHNYWQWGITPNDMIDLLYTHGFDLAFMKDYGPFSPRKPWIVNHGMVFARSKFR